MIWILFDNDNGLTISEKREKNVIRHILRDTKLLCSSLNFKTCKNKNVLTGAFERYS